MMGAENHRVGYAPGEMFYVKIDQLQEKTDAEFEQWGIIVTPPEDIVTLREVQQPEGEQVG